MKYAHHNDVLKQLRNVDGVSRRVILVRDCVDSISQTLANAADEIERLRAENKELKIKYENILDMYDRCAGSL